MNRPDPTEAPAVAAALVRAAQSIDGREACYADVAATLSPATTPPGRMGHGYTFAANDAIGPTSSPRRRWGRTSRGRSAG